MVVTGWGGGAEGRPRRATRAAGAPPAAGPGTGGLPACGSEEDLQARWAAYLGSALPEGALHHHSPNEGRRGWRAQRALKSGGTLAGMPDSMVLWQGRAYFLELKVPGRKPTPRQAACHAALRAQGFPVAVGTSLDELAGHLAGWGVPLGVSVAEWLRPRGPVRMTTAAYRALGASSDAGNAIGKRGRR